MEEMITFLSTAAKVFETHGMSIIMSLMFLFLICREMMSNGVFRNRKNEEKEKEREERDKRQEEKIDKMADLVEKALVSDDNPKTDDIMKGINDIDSKVESMQGRLSDLERKMENHINDTKKVDDSGLPKKQLYTDNRINGHLQKTRERLCADRIDMFLFSNGSRSTTGNHEFVNFNLRYSRVRSGATHIKSVEQCPYGYLSSLFEDLLASHSVIFSNEENMPSDPMVLKWIEATGAKKTCIQLIENDGIMEGFIVTLFGDSRTTDDENIKYELSNLAGWIVNMNETTGMCTGEFKAVQM